MNSIEFRVVRLKTVEGISPSEISVIDPIIDGVRFLDLVRQAEMPYALEEQQEDAAEYAPDPAPLLAAAYTGYVGPGWPSRHLLGEPLDEPYNREEGETMLLDCTCGISDCWALLARVEVSDTVVRWSAFRNNWRDWDLSALGPFSFSRAQYEESLRRTARCRPHDRPSPGRTIA